MSDDERRDEPPEDGDGRDYTYRARGCFACGTENPISLGIRPWRDGDRVRAEVRLDRGFRGFSTIAHGGISYTVLDEVMSTAASTRVHGLTATVAVNVRYRAPVPVEDLLHAEAWVVGEDGRDLEVEGRLHDASGRLLVEARGRFRALKPETARVFKGEEEAPTRR